MMPIAAALICAPTMGIIVSTARDSRMMGITRVRGCARRDGHRVCAQRDAHAMPISQGDRSPIT